MKKRSETTVPVAFLLLVGVLSIAILPSALRPPPDTANNSAALSPDAPPDDAPEAIISTFQQAGSSTAGSQKSTAAQQVAAATTTTLPPPPPPEKRASSGLCFGNPPRQTESLYAPECKPAFIGDNGGSTHKNITSEEVRVGFYHVLGMPANPGPIPREPPDGNEGGSIRTHRVLQTYFNQRYETYGRFVQMVAVDQASRSDPDERVAAKAMDEEQRTFMSTHLDLPFCEEYVRRDLVCFNANPFTDEVYDRLAPNFYSYQMRASQNDAIGAEYTCKRLAPFTADFAGGLQQGQPRKFGILYEDGTGRSWENIRDAIKAKCGVDSVGFNVLSPEKDAGRAQEIPLAIASFQQAGVTSIILANELVGVLLAMQQAESVNYQPEWIIYGSYGLDFNTIGKTYPSRQAQHTFGMSGWELPRRGPQTECVQAYKSIDPNNDPDGTVCNNFFFIFQQMFIAIQEAGPNLTPQTIRDGLYGYGYRFPEEIWAAQGGYSPGDNSFIDEFGEIWWDPTAGDVTAGGAPGAFRWVDNATRYGIGEIPEGQPDLFGDNGINTVQ